MVTLTLPAIQQPSTTLDTDAGRLVVPGQRVAEKRIDIDPKQIQTLLLAARRTAQNAYAPHSQFRVGAALIMADDPKVTLFSGTNVENNSYGLTCCAERSALFHAASNGFRQLRYLAISTVDSLASPLAERAPCGACRQVIKEFSSESEALIFIDSGGGNSGILCDVFDIERLLPYGFELTIT